MLQARRPGLGRERRPEYYSAFAAWYTRSTVRSKPRRLFDPEAEKLFFPPELLPAIGHQEVVERGPEAATVLQIQRLYAYLQFTTQLEQVQVLPVTQRISVRSLGLDLPQPMIFDAFKICTDEAWHAQFSYDLSMQVVAETGVDPVVPRTPSFLLRLSRLRDELDPDVRGLAELFFTIVSETLISSILVDIPRDPRIHTAVRELVRDHAEDEGRHHSYFSALLRHVWPALGRRERSLIGPLVPEFIQAFLEPDRLALGRSLEAVGLAPEAVERVLSDCYPPDAVAAGIREAARATVRGFEGVDALADPATREAFERHGLIPTGALRRGKEGLW